MNIANWILTDSQGNILAPQNQTMLDLGATGLNEILQNVRVILTTRVGTVMLDRLFGMRFRFVDAPMNAAQLMIVADVCQALTHFEPRVTFKKIQFGPSVSNLGEMDVLLSIDVNLSTTTLSTR
jgi:phage baseplate assembly protein W